MANENNIIELSGSEAKDRIFDFINHENDINSDTYLVLFCQIIDSSRLRYIADTDNNATIIFRDAKTDLLNDYSEPWMCILYAFRKDYRKDVVIDV